MHTCSFPRSAVRAATAGLAALALLLPIAGCAEQGGAPDPIPGPTGTSMESPAPAVDDPGVPGPVGPDDPGSEEGAVLAWLPPGPASPNDPAPDSWYAALQARDCAALAGAVGDDPEPLWDLAILVCRALDSGAAADWEAASAAMSGVPEPDAEACLELAVFRASLRAVGFRAENPTIAEVPVEQSAGSACPVQLTGLSTGGISVEDDPVASSCGGDRIRLMGRLFSVTSVIVGSTAVRAEQQGENQFWFVSPPGDPGTVTVTAEAEDGAVPGTSSLTFLDASPCPGPSPSPTDTSEPIPSPSETTGTPPMETGETPPPE